MPKRVSLKNHINALKMLSRSKKADYKLIVDNTPSLSRVMKHLCRYILNGTIKLEKHHVDKLKPHKIMIRKLARSGHKTIKTSMQKGGSIIQSIIKTVLPLLPSLLL